MLVVSIFATVVYYLLLIYFLTMWARFVLDLVRQLRRGWRPRGVSLVAAEAVYTVTDPPIRLFRRLMPPVGMGPVALDFGWPITMLCCIVLMYVAGQLMAL
ncbi:YggT family protein [Gryllotalpicola ginsengisoli]|uniref:YggT family protein n=1 Tax=Gryllotalpicola ginsengisoli TaxID=444608 RepID=UPI0003B6ED9B|nr:YggT family protein [Gryllotalpicola ginsengisoli]